MPRPLALCIPPRRRRLPLVAVLVATVLVFARAAPVQAQAPVPPRSLTPSEAEALLEGRGMGLARAAEMSGLPGPRHVLELADSLALTPDQAAAARALVRDVEDEAQALGAEIVEAERALSGLFDAEPVDVAALEAQAHEVARLRADLRLIHLRAHIAMREALTATQVARYMTLRHGAGPPGAARGGAAHPHHRP